jgi:hypothetical protein
MCRKICFKTPSLCRCLPATFAMRADHGATDGDERLRCRLGGVLMHRYLCDLLREHDTVAFEVTFSSSIALHILPSHCCCAVKPGEFVDRKRLLPRERYYPGSLVAIITRLRLAVKVCVFSLLKFDHVLWARYN